MSELLQQALGQTEWNSFPTYWLPVGFKIIISIVCGGIIGLERELKHKPAGLRTNILICLGATLFTVLSLIMAESAGPGHPGDPARLAAQIVSGVGFLGGGMILQSGGGVSGLTSAATVWVVAAIGVCIGMGYPVMALIFTVTVVFTLYFMSIVDNKILGKINSFEVWVHLNAMNPHARASVMNSFHQLDLELKELLISDSDAKFQIMAKYFSSETKHLRLQALLWSVPEVDKIDVKVN